MSFPPLVKKDFIHEQYNWTTGAAVGRFLGELKQNRRIMAAKCPACGVAYMPPVKRCGACHRDTEEWVEVGPGGKVTSFTVAREGVAGDGLVYPLVFAMIRLDGADTDFIHHLGEIEPSEVKTGMRVEPVWSDTPKGSVRDIKYFKKVAGSQ